MDLIPTRSDDESFTFGLAELRRAAAARGIPSAPGAPPGTPAVPAAGPVAERCARTVAPPLGVMKPQVSGFDPYNSSGGIERHNAWNRIRKR